MVEFLGLSDVTLCFFCLAKPFVNNAPQVVGLGVLLVEADGFREVPYCRMVLA